MVHTHHGAKADLIQEPRLNHHMGSLCRPVPQSGTVSSVFSVNFASNVCIRSPRPPRDRKRRHADSQLHIHHLSKVPLCISQRSLLCGHSIFSRIVNQEIHLQGRPWVQWPRPCSCTVDVQANIICLPHRLQQLPILRGKKSL